MDAGAGAGALFVLNLGLSIGDLITKYTYSIPFCFGFTSMKCGVILKYRALLL